MKFVCERAFDPSSDTVVTGAENQVRPEKLPIIHKAVQHPNYRKTVIFLSTCFQFHSVITCFIFSFVGAFCGCLCVYHSLSVSLCLSSLYLCFSLSPSLPVSLFVSLIHTDLPTLPYSPEFLLLDCTSFRYSAHSKIILLKKTKAKKKKKKKIFFFFGALVCFVRMRVAETG